MPKRLFVHSTDISLKCGDLQVTLYIPCHHCQRKRRKQNKTAGEANRVEVIRTAKMRLMGRDHDLFNLRETHQSLESILSNRTPYYAHHKIAMPDL
jgi:hypothetical protein